MPQNSTRATSTTRAESSSDSSRTSRGSRFADTTHDLITGWRYRGHTGRLIRRHRALRTLDLRPSSIVHPVLLGAGFLAIMLEWRGHVANLWAGILRFWCDGAGLEATIRLKSVAVTESFVYQIPVLHAPSPLPGIDTLRISLISICLAMLLAYLFVRRFLPLCYLIWAISLIQAGALAHFYLQPGRFPYSVGTHVSSSLEIMLVLLLLIPPLLTVAYYPLNFPLYKKIGLTVLMIGFVVIFAPHLYACHLVLMSHLSVLYMPILFTVFGMLPVILMIVALYGWGMSWTTDATR